MIAEQIFRASRPVIGFGNVEALPPAAAAVASGTETWGVVFATSVVSAVTGLVVEEIARKVRESRR